MKRLFLYMTVVATALIGCADHDELPSDSKELSGDKISLCGEIEQVYKTRASDEGFANGDVMGVYIVDYNGTQPGTLLSSGNRCTNLRHTYNEATNSWQSAYDVYWKDKNTHIDVYGYYPVSQSNPEDVNAYAFSVQANQSTDATSEGLGGYEASDLLWGKVEDVAPTSQVIPLPLRHRMSTARIELTEGTGFDTGEFAKLEKTITVKNTLRNATIDLATGSVTATGSVEQTGIIPYNYNNVYRCIIVPQIISAGKVLFAFSIGGLPYTFKKAEDFEFLQGKMHTFTIEINKKEQTGTYELVLVGESITAWENDDVSHDATMKEYVVINSTAGQLKEAIIEAGKDYTQLRNLKITGQVNANDFFFMRDEMSMLQSLNMKEMEIVAVDEHNALEIPNDALSEKTSLLRMVLPDKLRVIREGAFYRCSNITGSLIIPEGVTRIEGAFNDCSGLTGTLSLPSTLEYIGGHYSHAAFAGCGFTCELKLPESLTYISEYAFLGCHNLYGEVKFPSRLTHIGQGCFEDCPNLSGSIEIPQTITEIPAGLFAWCSGLNGNLILHDGITSIGSNAFAGTSLKGELSLPKNLVALGNNAFDGCDFSGELIIPKTLATVGSGAFAKNWRLIGVLEFPEGLLTIGADAFAYCRSIEGLVFPESVESIGSHAFLECFGIGSIVSKSGVPAYVANGAFDGVAKDNFTLEVPESAIHLYQSENGWCDFKRIAAHRELVCRPSIACAINTESKRTLVLNAEGDWEVTSIPDWCELSQMSGSKKTELTLTIKQMTAGAETRTGEIVFKLKGKDYTHKCTVTQYDYQYGEDEVVNLQKATRGNNGGINIVFVGDGYDAKDISEGKYIADMQEEMEYFFGVEPYKTYRDYFNVNTAIAVSPETGIGTVNTIRYARFGTTFAGGVGLRADQDAIVDYAKRIPSVNDENIDQTLIIVIPNSTDYGGICYMWESGTAIAFCPKSTYGYPLDSRGVIQHEAGGHGFGKLGDEYIYHNAFIDMCGCTCCGHVDAVLGAKSIGWYDNIDVTGKMHEVTWSHLIFDERYSDIVDIYEGAFMHNRGAYRSEQNSCMNNDIPYYSTISRESIVRRIKKYAGEVFSFEDFVANDKREAGSVTRALNTPWLGSSIRSYQHAPVILKGKPGKKRQK